MEAITDVTRECWATAVEIPGSPRAIRMALTAQQVPWQARSIAVWNRVCTAGCS